MKKLLMRLGIKLQSQGLSEKQKVEIDHVTKALAVTIYSDAEEHDLEKLKANEIIENRFKSEDERVLALSKLSFYLFEYKKDKVLQERDEHDVAEFINRSNDWELVDDIEAIIEADDIREEGEKSFLSKVIEVKRQHRALVTSIELRRKEIEKNQGEKNA